VIDKGKGKLVVDPHLGAARFFSPEIRFVLLDSQPVLSKKLNITVNATTESQNDYDGVFVVKSLYYSTV